MRKSIVFLLALVSVTGGCALIHAGSEKSVLERSEMHRASIESFVSQAAEGRVNSLMKSVAGVTLEMNGRQALEEYLQRQVVPFFQDFSQLAWSGEHYAVGDGEGNTGVQYYEYIETNAGVPKPFVITLFPEGRDLKVTSIEVGECYPGYHSDCP